MSGRKENIQHAYIFKAVLKTLKGALCFEPVKSRVPSLCFFNFPGCPGAKAMCQGPPGATRAQP